MPLFIFLIIDNNKKSKMKKITKTNFQGLRQLFPVLGKEDMRHYVGGYSNGYWNGNWNNPYSYFADVGVMIIAVLNAIRALNVKNL